MLCGAAEGLGLALAAGEVVVVVVAGDIPGTDAVAIGLAPGDIERAGVVPGIAGRVTGLVAGTAGEVTGAVAGLVTGAVAGLVAGALGDWPNVVSARVMMQRLAICSVFIGLILDCPDHEFR